MTEGCRAARIGQQKGGHIGITAWAKPRSANRRINMELGPRQSVPGLLARVAEGTSSRRRAAPWSTSISATSARKNCWSVCRLSVNWRAYVVDPVKEPIPVRPTAHYTMGGIETDQQCETGSGCLPWANARPLSHMAPTV